MKKLYYLDEQEKQRILNLHTESTKRQYLPQKEVLKEWSYVDDLATWLLKRGTVKNVNKLTKSFREYFSKDKQLMWYATQFTDDVLNIISSFRRNFGNRFSTQGGKVMINLPIQNPTYSKDQLEVIYIGRNNDFVDINKAIGTHIKLDTQKGEYIANRALKINGRTFKNGEVIPENLLFEQSKEVDFTEFLEETFESIKKGKNSDQFILSFTQKGANLTNTEINDLKTYYEELRKLPDEKIKYQRGGKAKLKVAGNYTKLGVGTLALTGGLEYLFSSLMGRDKKDVGIATMKARCASKGNCDDEFKKKYEQVIIAIKKATESTMWKMPFLYQTDILSLGDTLNNSIENWDEFCNLNACFKKPANSVDPASGIGYSLIDLLNNEIFDNAEYNMVGCAVTKWKANAYEFDNIINNSASIIWKQIEKSYYEKRNKQDEKEKLYFKDFDEAIKNKWESSGGPSLGNKILNTWALAQGLKMGKNEKEKYYWEFRIDHNTDTIVMALYGINGSVALMGDNKFYLGTEVPPATPTEKAKIEFNQPITSIEDIFNIYWLLAREECMSVGGMQNPF